MKRTTLAIPAGLMTLVLLLVAGHAGSKTRTALEGGASSKEKLVQRFLDAIEAGDALQLRSLRVSEDEYVNVILPGAVPEGQPLRVWPENVRRYFAREFIEKSEMTATNLIAAYGGHRYRIASMSFEEGTKRYANHFVYRKLRLQLEDETGAEHSLATGSIVEIGGHYKFMSYLPG